jgi:hypothetical protein
VQLGKLDRVKEIVNHHNLSAEIIEIKGLQEECIVGTGEMYRTDNWNPLLLAVGFKRTDIVKYLIRDLNISLRLFYRKPLEDEEYYLKEPFLLTLAIQNEDINTLTELLTHFRAFDIDYITWALKIVVKQKWIAGIDCILNSPAAK